MLLTVSAIATTVTAILPAEDSAPIFSTEVSSHALEAPRTPYQTLPEYAVVVAGEIGIEKDKFAGLIACESQWEETAIGDNGKSHGVLQFREATFAEFAKRYGLKDVTRENPYDQIDLAALMIRNGYVFHWENCGKKVGWIP